MRYSPYDDGLCEYTREVRADLSLDGWMDVSQSVSQQWEYATKYLNLVLLH